MLLFVFIHYAVIALIRSSPCDALQKLNGAWFYNWGATTACSGPQFIPMIWGRNQVESMRNVTESQLHAVVLLHELATPASLRLQVDDPVGGDGSLVLGFNEPDNDSQARAARYRVHVSPHVFAVCSVCGTSGRSVAESRSQSASMRQPCHGLQLHVAGHISEVCPGCFIIVHRVAMNALTSSPALSCCSGGAPLRHRGLESAGQIAAGHCDFDWCCRAQQYNHHGHQVHQDTNLPILLTEWAAQVLANVVSTARCIEQPARPNTHPSPCLLNLTL
jgi:hypothetical protein